MQSRYNVLPTDPRWLALDDEQVLTLYWAHHYAEKGVPDEIVDENFDENEEKMDELFGVERADPPPTASPDDEFEDLIDDRRN